VKGLKTSSIKIYLASLETLHVVRAESASVFQHKLVKIHLRGAANLELYKAPAKATRKVMSLPLLKLLGHEIASVGWQEDSRRVVWSAACLAFFGALRMGEILSPREGSFCPEETLLWRDVKQIDEGHLLIHLKMTKARSKEGDFVDIFSFKDPSLCPVAALRGLKQCMGGGRDADPVFKFKSGLCLSTGKFTELVRALLASHLGKESQEISGHSFRPAIPSELAKFPEMSSSEEIMGWGRWESKAYLSYTRLKSLQKRKIFAKIESIL
jgi:hypothetical protein